MENGKSKTRLKLDDGADLLGGNMRRGFVAVILFLSLAILPV